MASGDKTRLAWYSELETTNTNVTTVTTDVTSLQETVTATTTGLVDKVAALESAVEDIEGTASTEITVTAVLDENTTLAVAGATDGYYIFTSAPADLATYLSGGSINDVWQCSSAVWTTYLAYADCPATLAVAATQGADETTYQKSEGSWIEVGTGSGGGSITVTALYTSSTTIGNVSSAGYYIWTDTLPSDYTSYFTEGDISINDVLYYDGDAWDLYSTYVNAPASIYNEDDTSTYEKFESGWVISASALNEVSRDLDYGMFTLSSALSMSGVGTYLPVDTTVSIVGDVSLSTNGINLIGGRTYKLTYSPYLNGMSSTNSTMSFYNYTTSTEIDPSTYLVAVTSSSAVITDNVVSTIYTPDSDCVVCIYVSTTTTGTFTANRGNKIVVEELPAQVTSYLDPDSVEVTNNDTATELQVLVSNGDETATFMSTSDAGILGFNATAQTVDCNDMTTTGVYAITSSSTNLPTYVPSGIDYLVLEVQNYNTTNGSQTLKSCDYDSATDYSCIFTRSWESTSFTNWKSYAKFDDATVITSGEVLTAADAYGTVGTGLATSISGALTLKGNFGGINSYSTSRRSSALSSASTSTSTVYWYQTSTTDLIALSDVWVINTPLGNNQAKVDIYGYATSMGTDEIFYIYYPSGTWTDIINIQLFINDSVVSTTDSSSELSIVAGFTNSNQSLNFNRADDISGTSNFYYHATGYKTGYVSGD